MDRITKEQRSKTMRAVKSKDSKIEIALRKALWNNGFRYRKHYAKLIGKPDVVLVSSKIAIFCDSEFWHGYKWNKKKYEIKSNREFWYNKIERNMQRDKQVTKKLKKEGWTVVRFWEHEITSNIEKCVKKVREAVVKNERFKNT